MDNYVGKTMLSLLKLMFGSEGKALTYMRKGEQAWQALVGEVKSTIVLKTFVLPFNIMSNYFVSFMHGMPAEYIFKKQAEGVMAVDKFMQQQRELMIARRELSNIGISKDTQDKLKGKIKQLEYDIARNPIRPLIEQGMLNTIVEDIALEEEEYGLRAKIEDWLDGKTKRVPESIKESYRWAYLTRSNPAFKFLEKTTRYSDLVARYAMYEWYTKEKKINKDETLKVVMESFVEYDPPTSRELQYLNDIGLVMFTKYGLRIQKTLFRLLRDKPDSVIGMYALENYFNMNVPTPMDAFIPNLYSVTSAMESLAMPGVQLVNDIVNLGPDIEMPIM
jgi:hypothetical protein